MRTGGASSAGRLGKAFGGVVRILLVIALALGLIGYVAVPTVSQAVNMLIRQARQIVAPTFVPARPAGVSASEELRDHRAANAVDLVRSTYWAAGGRQPTLTLTFDRPTDVDALIVTSGAADRFTELRRPRELEILYSDGTTANLSLADVPDPQTTQLSGRAIIGMRITIVSDYPSIEGSAVAISELEFFTKE